MCVYVCFHAIGVCVFFLCVCGYVSMCVFPRVCHNTTVWLCLLPSPRITSGALISSLNVCVYMCVCVSMCETVYELPMTCSRIHTPYILIIHIYSLRIYSGDMLPHTYCIFTNGYDVETLYLIETSDIPHRDLRHTS